MPVVLLRRSSGFGAPRQKTGEDSRSAISELSRELTDGKLGNFELFEKLTGNERLWWRCCRDAARSQPSWVRFGDHDRALQIIIDTELVASRGAISRAAEAVDLICQALVAPAGDGQFVSPLSETVARAADCWNGSLAVLAADQRNFSTDNSAACAVPSLRSRVGEVLASLSSVSTDARQAMTAICALLLAIEQPDLGRPVAITVVFARPGDKSDPARGVAGTLELREFPAGPAGLFPDPRGMRIRRGDSDFGDGLKLAWQFAAGADQDNRCVLWRLSLDDGVPDYDIDGGSLGAAFAVGLRELLRKPRSSRPASLAALRSFFVGLRPGCAITGVLVSERPSAYERLTSRASAGPWLDEVGDMQAKISAARAKGLRLVAPEANRASWQSRTTVPADWAATIRQADRHGRRIRPVRTAITVFAVLAMIAGGAAVDLASLARAASDKALTAGHRAVAAHHQALSDQVITEAEQIAGNNPALAAQLTLVANQTSPTPGTESRILNTAASPLPAAPVLSGDTVSSMAFSPDGRTLATSDDGGNVWLWNASSPDRFTQLGQPLTARPKNAFFASVAFSPDGRTLAAGTSNGTVTFWTTSSPLSVQIQQLPANSTSTVQALAFSPGGRMLATGSDGDGLWLWNTSNPGHPVDIAARLLSGSAASVASVAFSADGQILAAGTGNGVWLWRINRRRTPVLVAHVMSGAQGSVSSVAFSPHDRTLAVATYEGQVWLWDAANPHKPKQQFGSPLTGPVNSFNSVAFSPNGRFLAAAGGDGNVWMWDVSYELGPVLISQFFAGPSTTSSTSAGNGVQSVAFSPDGRSLITHADKGLVSWSLPSGLLGQPAQTVQSVAYTSDGHDFLAYSRDPFGGDGGVWTWNGTHPASLSEPLKGPALWLKTAGYGQDDRIIAAGTGPKGLWLWDSAHPDHRVHIARPGPENGNDWPDYTMALSPDGHTLAAVGTDDSTAWLWSTTDLAHVVKLRYAVNGDPLTFSLDGRTLAAGNSDGDVWLFSTSGTGKPIKLGHPPSALPYDAVSSVAFSPAGHIIAAASQDQGETWLWNISHPDDPIQLREPLTGSTVAFSPDGDILALGGSEVRLVDTGNPARPSQLGQPLNGPPGGVTALAFSPGARYLAVGGHDGTIQLWNLDIDAAVDWICAATRHALTPALWREYVPQLPYHPPCAHPAHYGLLGR